MVFCVFLEKTQALVFGKKTIIFLHVFSISFLYLLNFFLKDFLNENFFSLNCRKNFVKIRNPRFNKA